jgi:hypothetical protein
MAGKEGSVSTIEELKFTIEVQADTIRNLETSIAKLKQAKAASDELAHTFQKRYAELTLSGMTLIGSCNELVTYIAKLEAELKERDAREM